MPILTQDIKILKSAVMNDSTDGGGRMTGAAVIDGQSNSLFPDTSAMDRAFGRVQMRKLFGVAHTNDTDTLMGAHAIITETPSDPNVHCTLMKTPNWGDQRNTAKELIERYLVKGPRSSWRIYDTHYEGSARLRLYAFTNLQPPASGESLCLINPNGAELYVRILRMKSFTEKVYLQEGSGTVEANAVFIECDLGQTLTMNVYGPPIARSGLNESQYAMVYTTVIAAGVKFYGSKALGFAGQVGEFNVETVGGIFTPLVPAATVETAVVDQYPLLDRAGFVNTGYARLQTTRFEFATGKTIRLPTPVVPKTITFVDGGGYTYLSDDGNGKLVHQSTDYGLINYTTGELIKTNPNWPGTWGATVAASYIPATKAGAATKSDAIEVDAINQGLVFTKNLLPIPAPSTLALSYMAQGRWYQLTDNGSGKLSGGDSSYGSGTVNYATGSVSLTLGAMPDIGSCIIFEFGSQGTAVAPDRATLPTRLSTTIDLGNKRVSLTSLKFTLPNGVTPFGVSDPNNPVITTGNGKFTITPNHVGKSLVVEWQEYADARTATADGAHKNQFTLTDAPVLPNTVRFNITYTPPANHTVIRPDIYHIRDNGNGKLVLQPLWKDAIEVGTVNYATGLVTLNATVNVYTTETYTYGVRRLLWWDNVTATRQTQTDVGIAPVRESVMYSGEMGTVNALTVTPEWFVQLPRNLVTSGLTATAPSFGSSLLFTSANGVLYTEWNCSTGSGTARGSVSGDGRVVFNINVENSAVPNTLTWHNVAVSTVDDTVTAGIFRTANAPLKQGMFQLVDSSNRALQVNVDYQRGIVRWTVPNASESYAPWKVKASTLRYNTVYLEYLPLEASILGLNTARLPLDGKVPVYRSGDLCVVHNTQTLELPNPLVKGSAYTLRERLASVRVKDAMGVVVPDTKYQLDLNAGTILFPTGISISDFAQPFTVEHRIEDLLLCSQADISGKLRFTRSLTHDFPAGSSYVSSALPFGDLFARFYNVIEQQTWTNEWRDERIGASMTANFNETDYPIQVTNRGTIKERWAVIFTGSTTFRVVGESVGEIGYGNTAADCAPTNNATAAPYFVIPALGWGAGWSAGNVLRFNTDACGAPFWIVRTILQGPASVESDTFALAFRGDVDRP
jgi:hypothetical protein